eukprot:11907730-Prorocentrum_lima.AAC.1
MVACLARVRRQASALEPAGGLTVAQQVSPWSRVRWDLARSAGQAAAKGPRDRTHAASPGALAPD